MEKEQIWVKIVTAGGKVNSQNEHVWKTAVLTLHNSRPGVMDNVVPVPG